MSEEESESSSSSEEEDVVVKDDGDSSSVNCFFSMPGVAITEDVDVEETRPTKKRRKTNAESKVAETKKMTKITTKSKLPSAIQMLSLKKGAAFLKPKFKKDKKLKVFEKQISAEKISDDSEAESDEDAPNLGQMRRYQQQRHHKNQGEYRRKRPIGGDWAYRVEVGKEYLQDKADANDIEERKRDRSFSKRKWWKEDW